MKTVAVLGASYGGSRAAQLLASSLPNDWRVVMVDRNSHMNHLYVLPRYAVIPNHSHKAFLPYPHILNHASTSPRHLFLHAQVTSVHDRYITLSKSFPEYGIEGRGEGEGEPRLEFDYLVYALGSHLPTPINLWGPVGDEDAEMDSLTASPPPPPSNSTPKQEQEDLSSSSPSASLPPPPPSSPSPPSLTPIQRGTKQGGITWLNRFRDRLERAASVLVVGGGALGIQYATDIAEVFPTKHVTLLHSRSQLLPRFDEGMHDEILSALSSLNITTILNERLDLSFAGKISETNERVVKTMSGREIRAEVVLLCTGQIPNTALLRDFIPECIVTEGQAKGQIRVKRTMQVGVPVSVPGFGSSVVGEMEGPEGMGIEVPAATPSSSSSSSSSSSCEMSPPSCSGSSTTSTPALTLSSPISSSSSSSSSLSVEKKVEVELPEDLPERVLLENLEEYEEYDLSNEEALSDEDEEEEEEEEHEPPTPLSTTSDSHLFTPHPHIFAIGDAADSFGAINAGHNAYFQADIAAKNILKLVMQRRVVEQAGERVVHVHEGGGGVRLSDNEALSEDEEGEEEEEEEDIWEMVEYTPGPPAIKVSLGLTKSLFQFNGVVGTKTDVPEDLDAGLLWKFYGVDVDEEGMYA